MALSMDVLYQPLRDFFLAKLGGDNGGRVHFRFDKIGSVLGDGDFTDAAHAGGYVPALAIEKFSDLVNRIPVDAGDDVNVVLTQDSIDDTYYFRLLDPAVASVPDGTDATAAGSLTDTFNEEKAKAKRLWEEITMESLTGLPLAYKPSLATPETWYDSTKTDIWTHQTFHIEQPSSTPAPQADTRLWRLAPPVGVIDKVIGPIQLEAPLQPAQPAQPAQPDPPDVDLLRERIKDFRVSRAAIVPSTELHADIAQPVGGGHLVGDAFRGNLAAMPVAHLEGPADHAAVELTPDVQPQLAQPLAPDARIALARRVSVLDIRDRLLVGDLVAQGSATAPVATDSIDIAFDYCVVQIRRPWMFDIFLTGNNWAIPGVEQGALSQANTPGGLTQLPIAVVAIRNLQIRANWSTEDLEASKDAVAFGPFKVEGGIIDGALTHQSIQTIGWLLEALPPLPPHAYSATPPSSAPITPADQTPADQTSADAPPQPVAVPQ